jgi:ribose/xylose/arabinose/galactoside ABC-type transport system permease subunit
MILGASLILVWVYLAIRSPYFLQPVNMSNLARQMAVLLILGVGQTPIIIARGFDLTVGSMLGFSSVIGATAAINYGIGVGLLAFVGVGATAGLLHAILIARFALSSIVVTLGGLTFYRGLAIWLTAGRSITGLPDEFARVGNGAIGPVPIMFVIAAFVVVIGVIVLHGTRFGTYIYAVGASPRTAALSGIRVKLTLGALFVISGLLAGLAGFLLTAYVNVGQAYFGLGAELQVIAAVFIGGVSFYGGRGSLLGVVAGVILLATLQNGLNLLGYSGFLQGLVSGVVLILALALQRVLHREVIDD